MSHCLVTNLVCNDRLLNALIFCDITINLFSNVFAVLHSDNCNGGDAFCLRSFALCLQIYPFHLKHLSPL